MTYLNCGYSNDFGENELKQSFIPVLILKIIDLT